MMLIGESLVLTVNLVLEVGDVMRGNLELALEFNYFVLCLNAVLGIQVSLCSNCFVQVLLLFHLSLILHILFLKLSNQILFQLYLFDHLHQICIRLVSVL